MVFQIRVRVKWDKNFIDLSHIERERVILQYQA